MQHRNMDVTAAHCVSACMTHMKCSPKGFLQLTLKVLAMAEAVAKSPFRNVMAVSTYIEPSLKFVRATDTALSAGS